MKKIYAFSFFILFSLVIFSQTTTFNYTGVVQTYTVPTCVYSVNITCKGGQGANANDRLPTSHTGGLGGSASGTLAVTPGQVLYIYVGGQGNVNGSGGFNGGGQGGTSTAGGSCFGGPAGGGGGASDVRAGGQNLTDRVIVGGGGGGSGRCYCNGTCQPCGCGGGNGGGGGLTGVNGGAAYNCGFGYPGSGTNFGSGGMQSGGGNGGPGDGGGPAGAVGTLGTGGTGGNGSYDVAGGGGGGGYYGGGGGGSASSGSGVAGGGGGGGASYIGGVTSGTTNSAVNSGDGQVTITSVGGGGSPMSLSGSQTNVTCNGACNGTAVVTIVSGGNSPYTYNWSNGGTTASVSSLCAGAYTVTVTEAGSCTASQGYTITQPTAITSTTNQINNPCNGLCIGAASISVSGGVSPYTYNWTPSGGTGSSANGLCAGSYTVTVTDANGCTHTKGVIITEPTAIGITSTQTNISCSGNCNGSASVTVTGGNSPYTYSWTPNVSSGASATGLCAGNYTVSVQDGNGCNKTQLITITQPQPLSAPATANPSSYCAGGCAVLTANTSGGTTPYSYTWIPGNMTGNSISVCPTSNTCYIVNITDANNCTATNSVCVNVNPLPNVSMSAQYSTTCVNWTTDLLLGAPSGGTFSGTAVTGNNFNPSVAGSGTFTITYTYTDGNNCTNSATTQIVVNVCTGINEAPPAIAFEVFPNPVEDFASVVVNDNCEISLLNMLGKEILSKKVPAGTSRIEMTGLPAGVYFIRVRTADGIATKKITKE